MKEYIAHVSSDGSIHLLVDHLKDTAKLAASFAGEFGAAEWGRLIGLWHDLGKFPDPFQIMIRAACGIELDRNISYFRVNHSTAGALHAIERFGLAGRIFAYPVAGHHAGLPDWEADETGNRSLSIRMKDEALLEQVRYESVPEAILSQALPEEKPPKGADAAFWIRMLFSCLVDADFLDTEAFFEKDKSVLRGAYPDLPALLKSFDYYMNEKMLKASDTRVNRLRASVLDRCIARAADNPGGFTLTVPTGGGKTLSSMAFALHHAVKHDKQRIVYVIPYISIIEQTADQFRQIFGDAVVEHHSNLEPPEEDENAIRRSLACENWDAPIIVTTAVQFFESLFASRTSRCRKLHNLVNSVVVLDEAQLLPPDYLNPILHVLDELRKHYGVTLLLTTATQPALAPQPSFGFRGLPDMLEIMDDTQSLHRDFKRVQIDILRPLSEVVTWEYLAQELQRYPSVLCIVNRRDDCRKLWQLMPEETFHLSALMCGAHRSKVISGIKERLRRHIPTRVVSTQLVEAGVDLDFPVVYRALCGLDSIAQAAGRCNREGLLERGRVVVFRPPTEPPVGHLRQAANIGKKLIEAECDDPISPERFKHFFEELYWLQGERLDAKDILKDLAANSTFRFSFRTAARKFKIIDETLHESVIVAYGEGADIVHQLERRPPDRKMMRRLQRYVVHLPRFIHSKLLDGGAIRQVHPGIFVQGHGAMYDEDVGFCVDRAAVYAPDDLIV